MPYSGNHKLDGRVRAKKHLGQHFLTDPHIAQKVADSVPGDVFNILEIGPGMGILTAFLLERKDINLKVVEIDPESVAYLHSRFPQLQDRIIEGDFLELPLGDIFGEPFFIVGNFPYNISSQILFRLFDDTEWITGLSGMFQREVARRIVSPPGNKDYGILSVLLQAYYDCTYLFTVNETVFSPPPRVKSGVIRLTRNSTKELPCSKENFKTVVKTGFNQRRKTLRNALGSLGIPSFSPIEPMLGKRAEQLSFSDFITLALALGER